MIEIRWHGRGGQGGFTASKLLGALVALYGNRYALAFPSFGPERRGAPVLAFTKIDDKKISDRSEVKNCDYIIILDETLFNEIFLQDLKVNGKIIINSTNAMPYLKYGTDKIIAIDATSIALDILEKPITNTAMLGALLGVSKIIGLDAVHKGMGSFFKGTTLKKNIEVVEKSFSQGTRMGL
ncbi:MAG: 2-oxoacid:acceptor oxidoreductase family protein [Actinomycetota bacterium]